jgi:hypothetical protein
MGPVRCTWLAVPAAACVLALSAPGSILGGGASGAASMTNAASPHRASGYLYYLDYSVDNGSIMRAAVPSGRPRQVVHVGDSAVWGMAVADGRLYWLAGVSTEEILYVSLHGTPRIHVLVRHLSNPEGLSLTAADGWLYWPDGTFVGRVRFDGSHLTRRFLDLRTFSPMNVAAGGHYLYLSGGDCGHIARVDLTDRHFDASFITLRPDACPGGLAVGGRYLYWLDPSSYIGRANLTGARPDDHWLNLHNFGLFDVAADSQNVFFDWQWTTGSSPGEDLKVGRAQADGTQLRSYVWLGQGPFALTAPGAGQ